MRHPQDLRPVFLLTNADVNVEEGKLAAGKRQIKMSPFVSSRDDRQELSLSVSKTKVKTKWLILILLCFFFLLFSWNYFVFTVWKNFATTALPLFTNLFSFSLFPVGLAYLLLSCLPQHWHSKEVNLRWWTHFW